MSIPRKLRPLRVLACSTRTIAAHLCARLYRKDLAERDALVRQYWKPQPPSDGHPPLEDLLGKIVPGFRCDGGFSNLDVVSNLSFVYENPDAPHLKTLRDRFGLMSLISEAPDEYTAMQAIGSWLGSRWDHGIDAVPGGSANVDAVRVIEQGMRGGRFWCEIAAKVAVQVFTALGWPARIVTASHDGGLYGHAVAEAWSNQFCKWIAIDTDFNVIFESQGVPLSAYELCWDAPAMQRSGMLSVRKLGKAKPNLPLIDLIPFYACVHVDMRSDWNSRRLRRGSPCGGDLSTWWTARPEFTDTLRPKIRMDDRSRFDWPVNVATLRITDAWLADGLYHLRAMVRAYAPYFAGLQQSTDDNRWEEIDGDTFDVALAAGHHTLSVRVRLTNGQFGPPSSIQLQLPEAAMPRAVYAASFNLMSPDS